MKVAGQLLGEPLTGDLFAVELFLRHQYIPIPRTIYQGVSKLGPAERVEFDLDGHIGQPERYCAMEFAPDSGASPQDWEAELAEALRDSINAHLRADVPFGVLLSGGVDSSLVAVGMSRLLARPVKAFTIAFDEAEFSEIEFAKTVAERLRHGIGISSNRRRFLGSASQPGRALWRALRRFLGRPHVGRVAAGPPVRADGPLRRRRRRGVWRV